VSGTPDQPGKNVKAKASLNRSILDQGAVGIAVLQGGEAVNIVLLLCHG
jgi:hypothetical protein